MATLLKSLGETLPVARMPDETDAEFRMCLLLTPATPGPSQQGISMSPVLQSARLLLEPICRGRMFKIRQKSTGLYWTNERWTSLEGQHCETACEDLDEDRELVTLTPVLVNTANRARGILIVAEAMNVQAGDRWRPPGSASYGFLCEVSFTAQAGHAISVIAEEPGSWGNYSTGTKMYGPKAVLAHVAAPGLYGGVGLAPQKEDELKKAEEVLSDFIGKSKPVSTVAAKVTNIPSYKEFEKLFPSTPHPGSGEYFLRGNMHWETGEQSIFNIQGELMSASFGGQGLLRGKFWTSRGSSVEGYLDGGPRGQWRWTNVTTKR